MKIRAWLTLPVTETIDGVIIIKASRPSTGPSLRVGAQGKLDSQGVWTHGHRTMDPRRGQKPGKTFSNPPKSHGHTREGSDLDERESLYPGHAVGNKRRLRPSESSRSEKTFEGVFYSSAGLGATIGDQYQGTRRGGANNHQH